MSQIDVDELERARDVQGLIAALKNPDHYVRQNAARALGRIGDRQAVDALKLLLADPYSYDPAENHRGDRAFEELGDDTPVYPVQLAAREALDWIANGYPANEQQVGEPEPCVQAPFQVGDVVEPYRYFSVDSFIDGTEAGFGDTKWKVLSIGPEEVSLQLAKGRFGDFVKSSGKYSYFVRDPGFVKNLKNSDFYTRKFPDRKSYQEVFDKFRKAG